MVQTSGSVHQGGIWVEEGEKECVWTYKYVVVVLVFVWKGNGWANARRRGKGIDYVSPLALDASRDGFGRC